MTPAGPASPIEAPLATAEHRFAVRVYVEDTDFSGVVYHANYLRYMERARSELLRAAGIDQRAAIEAGVGNYAVTSLAIRYAAPARLDDELTIVSRVAAVGGVRVAIHQRVMRGAVLLASADVVAALVAPDGRPRRQPAEWRARFHHLPIGDDAPR